MIAVDPGACAVNVSVYVPGRGAVADDGTAGVTVMSDSNGAVGNVSTGKGGMRARTCSDTRCETPTLTHAALPRSIIATVAGTVASTRTGMTLSACAAPTAARAAGDVPWQGVAVAVAVAAGVTIPGCAGCPLADPQPATAAAATPMIRRRQRHMRSV